MASKAADDVPSPSSSPSPPSARLSTSEHRLQLSTETSSGSRNCPIGPSSLHRLQKQMAPPIIQSHLEINESPLEHRNKDERDELIPSSRSPRHRQPTCHTAKKKDTYRWCNTAHFIRLCRILGIDASPDQPPPRSCSAIRNTSSCHSI